MSLKEEKIISGIIIESAIKVQNILGSGLPESVYRKRLKYELRKKGLKVEDKVPVAENYKNLKFSNDFKADLLINGMVIVLLKSTGNFEQIHYRQMSIYLKLSNKKLGLLVNFSSTVLRDGIKIIKNEIA